MFPYLWVHPVVQEQRGNGANLLKADKLSIMHIGMNYREIITIEPDKMGGKPCIRGLRFTVYDMLDYLASGMTEDEILADFPELRSDDIRASLAFAADRERRLLSTPA